MNNFLKIFFIILMIKNFYNSTPVYYELNFVKELTFQTDIGEIFVSEPNVIDVTVMSKRRILITTKGIGTALIRIKDKQKKTLVASSITVTPELKNISEWIKKLYPNIRIELRPYSNLVFLLGKVPSPQLSVDIEKLVKSFINDSSNGKVQVVNKLSIDMSIQVMLKVKVVELSRDISKQLGIEWTGSVGKLAENVDTIATGFNAGMATNTAYLSMSLLGALGSEVGNDSVSRVASSIASSVRNGVITNWSYGNNKIGIGITNLLDVLESESITSVLAEPTLVTMSGQEAVFHSGGEEGYIQYSLTNSGASTTGYMDYGVDLTFTPTVISENLISINLHQSVSSIRPTSSGKKVAPSKDSRSVDTTVQLADGQTIAVAGMLRRNVSNGRIKSGLLANLPVIGDLFGSKQVDVKETEVVITVTPYIIKPVKEQLFYPMNGISKSHPEDDSVNDNVTKFDKNLGISRDYNKHKYKIGGM